VQFFDVSDGVSGSPFAEQISVLCAKNTADNSSPHITFFEVGVREKEEEPFHLSFFEEVGQIFHTIAFEDVDVVVLPRALRAQRSDPLLNIINNTVRVAMKMKEGKERRITVHEFP
jgi:hypothetical protein